jgi:hypothetical protein
MRDKDAEQVIDKDFKVIFELGKNCSISLNSLPITFSTSSASNHTS